MLNGKQKDLLCRRATGIYGVASSVDVVVNYVLVVNVVWLFLYDRR